MKKLDEKERRDLILYIIANTKRKSRRLDILTLAQLLEKLHRDSDSLQATAKAVSLHPEMVRQILSVLTLPGEVQKLFSSRKIDSIDIAYRLTRLTNKEEQKELAEKIIQEGLPTVIVRDIVQYRLNYPEVSLKEAVDQVEKTKAIDVYEISVPLKEVVKKGYQAANTVLQDEMLDYLKNILTAEGVENVVLDGQNILITINKAGLSRLKSLSKSIGVPYKLAIKALLINYFAGGIR